jgi:16S rRNA (cytidine1402-2'-O)-methyltransferase
MPGRLIICATPIGNLGDAAPRLRESLEAADIVFAEDTRRSATLLRHFGLAKPLQSFFVGNEEHRVVELARRLSDGETVALVTDAGMPGVSDPGVAAVRAARDAEAHIDVVPGPSAVTTALAVSGFSADRFVFEGFLPRRGRGRADVLAALAGEVRTIVIFCATRRVGDDLADLATALGADRAVMVGRELTKLHEELSWTTLAEAAERWAVEEPRGEYTVAIEGAQPPVPNIDAALADVGEAMTAGVSRSAAVREAALRHGVSRRALYERAVKKGDESAL